jgi:hypothetical protein
MPHEQPQRLIVGVPKERLDRCRDDRNARAGSGRRVILLGCVKLKRPAPAPARDLYVSPLWRKRRAYAEASGVPWLILSAKHGVLDPDERLAPYDLALSQLPVAERRAWGHAVANELGRRFEDLRGVVLEVHAGRVYRAAIEEHLTAAGAIVRAPLAGLTQGRQLSWYTTPAGTPVSRR